MEKLLSLFPPQAFTAIGVFVVVFVVIFKDQIGDVIFRRKIKIREDDDGTEEFVERRKSNGVDVNRLFDMMERNIEAIAAFAHETKKLSETITELAEGMDKRSDRALKQHEEILDEIVRLDIPRRLSR